MNTLIVFAKNPIAGKVKSRLADKVGAKNALLIYNYLVDKVRKVCELLQHKLQLRIYYSENKTNIHRWPRNVIIETQKGDDLGARMEHAFAEEFERGATRICLVGTDIPDIDDQIILRAFEKLKNYDIVLGPAEDGGYYLIGMEQQNFNVFNNITWGTRDVLSQTIESITDSDLRYAVLPKLPDIDTENDLTEELRRLINK